MKNPRLVTRNDTKLTRKRSAKIGPHASYFRQAKHDCQAAHAETGVENGDP